MVVMGLVLGTSPDRSLKMFWICVLCVKRFGNWFSKIVIYIRMFSSSFSLCWAALQWRLIVDGCDVMDGYDEMDGWIEDGWLRDGPSLSPAWDRYAVVMACGVIGAVPHSLGSVMTCSVIGAVLHTVGRVSDC